MSIPGQTGLPPADIHLLWEALLAVPDTVKEAAVQGSWLETLPGASGCDANIVAGESGHLQQEAIHIFQASGNIGHYIQIALPCNVICGLPSTIIIIVAIHISRRSYNTA